MLNLVRELNRTQSDEVDYDYLLETYKQIRFAVCAVLTSVNQAEMFFRARSNPTEGKPKHVSALGAPKSEYVTGFQRCNAPGKPKFYAASKRKIALAEIGAKRGDTVFLSQWALRKGKSLATNSILCDDVAQSMSDKASHGDQSLIAHLDTIFTKRIHSDFSSDYKFTAAATEILTNHFPTTEGATDGKVGLVYPSVFDRKNSYNTAVAKEIADSHFEPIHVLEAEVCDVRGTDFSLKIIDTSYDFRDGTIHWNGSAKHLPALRKRLSSREYFGHTGHDGSVFWGLPTLGKEASKQELDWLLDESSFSNQELKKIFVGN